MTSKAVIALAIGIALLVAGIITSVSMFPSIRGSPDALSERVEISPKDYHNVSSEFEADVQMGFSISFINFSTGDLIEAHVLGPGNVTYGELTVDSIVGVRAFRTDVSGNYSLIVYNPGNESLDIRYFLGPTVSPTASLLFGAGTLLTLVGIIALIVAAVFVVIGRKRGG